MNTVQILLGIGMMIVGSFISPIDMKYRSYRGSMLVKVGGILLFYYGANVFSRGLGDISTPLWFAIMAIVVGGIILITYRVTVRYRKVRSARVTEYSPKHSESKV
jgi:hypothetical protein